MNQNKKLVIVQPYVPQYRIKFFEQLNARLANHGIDCVVAAGAADAQQSSRGDDARPDWVVQVPTKRLAVGRRSIILGGARPVWRTADAVIIGHIGSSVDTYKAIADAKLGRLQVGVWGHIKSYINDAHPVDAFLEKWQLRNVDHVFAYTPGGADYARLAGVPATRVTTVMNAVDTGALVTAMENLNQDDVDAMSRKYSLTAGRTVAYIGGLDESKRIDFLVNTLDILWATDPDIRVLVCGKGLDAALLNQAVSRRQVIMLGYADAPLQAIVGELASAILMPGRIGLVAVESLVLGRPIVTTDWRYHAPEAEYLTEGTTKITASNDPVSYADAIRTLLKASNGAERINRIRNPDYPSLEVMVRNYADGVLKMMCRA